MKSPNRERYGVDLSAHIQVHRYSWGGKASLRPEKKEARRKFRRRCQRLIHLIKKIRKLMLTLTSAPFILGRSLID